MSRLLDEAVTKLTDAYQSVLSAVTSDDLTPLRNAIALRQVGKSVSAGDPTVSVVVFGDLNRFKSLNDKFGHEAGDAAINYVGRLIDTLLVKSVDCHAFRRSGDEFVILTNHDGIKYVQEKAVQFRECRFTFNRASHATSMSFGFARADGKASFYELLERAEHACQTAKTRGDGEIVEWSSDFAATDVRSVRSRCISCRTRITCDVSMPQGTTAIMIGICPICRSEQIA